MKTARKLSSTFSLWHRVAMVTVGYGALMFSIGFALHDRLGFAAFLDGLTPIQLGLLLIGGGTVGLHLFEMMWKRLGQAAAVRRFAVWTQAVLLVACLATGFNVQLGYLFVLLALLHAYSPTLNAPRLAGAK